MFVWSGPNAVIRSTFSTECRKSERAGKRDEDHDEGLALQTTRGQIFFFLLGGVEMKEETAELWNLGEMIGELGRGGSGGPASVSLLLKVIYQRVSGGDVMDLARFDGSGGYWEIDCCHWRVFICGNHLLDSALNDV